MAYNLGINVVETNGLSAPALPGSPASVAGLLVRSQRGPIDRAVRISSYEQYLARFGEPEAERAAALCVQGFFDNGGREAYVTRVLGDEAKVATLTLPGLFLHSNKTAPIPSFIATAGYRSLDDPGTWANGMELRIESASTASFSLIEDSPLTLEDADTPASLESAPLESGRLNLSYVPTTLPGSNARVLVPQSLSFSVSGTPNAQLDVVFSYERVPNLDRLSLEEVADQITSQGAPYMYAYVETQSDGKVRLCMRTVAKGQGVGLALASSTPGTNALLGLNSQAVYKAGAAGKARTKHVFLAGVRGLRVGSWTRLSDGLTTEVLRIASIDIDANPGGGRRFRVTFDKEIRCQYAKQGKLGNRSTLSTPEFALSVVRNGRVLERWEGLSLDPDAPNYLYRTLNDASSGSAYVTVAPPSDPASSELGPNLPRPGRYTFGDSKALNVSYAATAGEEGASPTPIHYQDALRRFDTIDIQLLSVLALESDADSSALKVVIARCLAYSAQRGDCMFVGSTRSKLGPEAAKSFGQEFQGEKVYGALYWPWITVSDPAGSGPNPQRKIPPTGHVLGVYARTEQGRGIWKAPAGNEAVIRGALAVERELTETDNTDLVKNGSVNTIRRLPGAGVVVDASRTLSTDPRWLFVGTRLLFNYVKTTLRDGLRWVKQEPNRAELWSKIKHNVVTPFLLGLYRQGAFGPGKAEETFTVVCGAENNPGEEIQQGVLHLDVYFYPSRPAETIVITVGQQDGGSTAGER